MFNLLVLIISITTLSVTYRGWVLTVLWSWFIAPLGVPEISVPVALGLVLIVSMFTPDQTAPKTSDKNSDVADLLVRAMAKAFLTPTIILAIGAFISLFA